MPLAAAAPLFDFCLLALFLQDYHALGCDPKNQSTSEKTLKIAEAAHLCLTIMMKKLKFRGPCLQSVIAAAPVITQLLSDLRSVFVKFSY